MYLFGMLLSNEKISEKIGNKMNEDMLATNNKLSEKIEKK